MGCKIILHNIDAIAILPDHLHCIWTLPENDANFQLVGD
jgi:putative transposase